MRRERRITVFLGESSGGRYSGATRTGNIFCSDSRFSGARASVKIRPGVYRNRNLI